MKYMGSKAKYSKQILNVINENCNMLNYEIILNHLWEGQM